MAKKMISLEISDELREALRKEAFIQSLSISAMIRRILEEKLFGDQQGSENNDK